MKFWFCLMIALLSSVFMTEGKTGSATVHEFVTSTGLATGPVTGPTCKKIPYVCDCHRVDKDVTYHIILVDTVDRYELGANLSCYVKIEPEDACLAKRCSLVEHRFEEDDGFKPSFYPVMFSVPPEEKMIKVSPNGRRHTRSDEICNVVPLKHAYVWCKRYENVTTCDVECQEGYFLQEGDNSVPKWTTRCKHDENFWAPHEWQECFPAVSCKARLIKTGKLKCVEPVDSNPYCEISCYEDETHDEVPLQRYDCYDDRFEDILPHCAVLDIDVKTVRKPKYWEW